MNVTPELREFSMELLVGMMIEGRVEQEGGSAKELFRAFRRSATMEALFDAETVLWQNGPVYLSDEWDADNHALQGAQR